MSENGIIVVVALAAFFIGGGLGYFISARRGRRAEADAARAEAELAAFRGNVTEHFRETAVKFRRLGEDYLALHEHLSEGADKLCQPGARGASLEFAPLAELEGPASATVAGAAIAAAGGDETTEEALAAVAGESARSVETAERAESVPADGASASAGVGGESEAPETPAADAVAEGPHQPADFAAEPADDAASESDRRTIH